ncbi:uncharacterized protein BT62DRAFT_899698 [Guyanagaster necrorhizus]|uniref:Uncharacterized protein n=1 Tax=Guyanagaster necrorhizus TaxID=856835 RepID=A0A9P7VPC5_9AGAR|nr:uncharacterized protein BT62DRAFT_899698 [Guyanagaster necrorhizus MCA 3950]KAG7444414.1 hypothetical protein BT62DRAFT_899698 [Guyanagaster necrorhizus MCA 3950]
MSLDQNLYTLLVTPNKDHPNVIDLVDPSGVTHYRKQRLAGPVYTIEVYDFMSESLLVTATAPSASSKTKILELYNPTTTVELKYTGTLTFRWNFKWENFEFEWKREECFMLRKPDPPVLVAITKEPAGRLKTSSIQILDYNLNRFDIDDRKGLEIVILTALLTFQDTNESYHGSPRDSEGLVKTKSIPTLPPPPPPKPPAKTGVDRIAEIQAMRGEINELTVEEEGDIMHYAQYCSNLLQDDAMLFVTVRSSSATQVPKVLQVVEETKRIRHKIGLDAEIFQYVLYDTLSQLPRRINLNDTPDNKYVPPNSLVVHLSKIPMPELQPAVTPAPILTSTLPPISLNSHPEKEKKRTFI